MGWYHGKELGRVQMEAMCDMKDLEVIKAYEVPWNLADIRHL